MPWNAFLRKKDGNSPVLSPEHGDRWLREKAISCKFYYHGLSSRSSTSCRKFKTCVDYALDGHSDLNPELTECLTDLVNVAGRACQCLGWKHRQRTERARTQVASRAGHAKIWSTAKTFSTRTRLFLLRKRNFVWFEDFTRVLSLFGDSRI